MVGFVHNTLMHVEKAVWHTNQYVALLALALVCCFFELETFIVQNCKAQPFRGRKLWYFLF